MTGSLGEALRAMEFSFMNKFYQDYPGLCQEIEKMRESSDMESWGVEGVSSQAVSGTNALISLLKPNNRGGSGQRQLSFSLPPQATL